VLSGSSALQSGGLDGPEDLPYVATSFEGIKQLWAIGMS
jgi:hypothetical protein